jgi:hypothetical protein
MVKKPISAPSQVSGIASDGEQRFRGGAEENVVNGFVVVKGDRGNLFRQGEDDVEILDWQELGLASLEPSGASQ